jgi:hypothetical protein
MFGTSYCGAMNHCCVAHLCFRFFVAGRSPAIMEDLSHPSEDLNQQGDLSRPSQYFNQLEEIKSKHFYTLFMNGAILLNDRPPTLHV